MHKWLVEFIKGRDFSDGLEQCLVFALLKWVSLNGPDRDQSPSVPCTVHPIY